MRNETQPTCWLPIFLALNSHSTALQEAYPDAVYLAAKETELPKEMFPEQCPYTCEQLLDDEFYPSGKSA